MMLVKKRNWKSFVWAVAFGLFLVVIVSLHDIAVQQKERIKTLVPPLIERSNYIQNVYNDNATRATKNHGSISDVTQESKLSPVTHIGLLKVHKAASTTTQAIFLRFGWRRNLTFVLSQEYNKFGRPNIISTNESLTKYNTLPPPPGKTFDILCNHVVYGEIEWSTVLPSDTVMIGTIREPFGHFKSVLNYFNPRNIQLIQTSIDPSDPVGAFLKNPKQYEAAKNVRHSFTNNRLAFEYGVSPEIIIKRDFAAFDKYLTQVLDKRFKVVLLAEQYDESLVLMKRKLNWSLKDIMYAVKNIRNIHKADIYVLKEEHRALHRNYSIFDYLLFEFFQDRLNEQIEAEGNEFRSEVDNFKEIRKYVENFCHSVPVHIKSLKIEESRWTESFDITRTDCELIHQGEISFVQMIRKRQYGAATWKSPKSNFESTSKKATPINIDI